MSRINGINFNYSLNGNNLKLYSKRTCSDNSELFITSKLNMLYKEAVSTKNIHNSKRNLKKMLEGSIFDEIC